MTRIDRRVMDEDHGRAPDHFGVTQQPSEGRELGRADEACGNERGPRHGARQRDDRRGPAQLDDRIRTGGQVERELREVAPQKRTEVIGKATLALDGRQVDVVVTGNHRHLRRARDSVEQPSRLLVLALEREVRDVTGDDDMIRACRGGRQDREQVLATVHAAAAQDEICKTGDALVEKHFSPLHASRRENVQVGDVRDAQHLKRISVGADHADAFIGWATLLQRRARNPILVVQALHLQGPSREITEHPFTLEPIGSMMSHLAAATG